MNWDAIGAIGEIVGALAVVLSLIYLASQIRVSNSVAQRDSRMHLLELSRAIWSGAAESPNLAKVRVKLRKSSAELSPEENEVARDWAQDCFFNMAAVVIATESNTISEATTKVYIDGTIGLLKEYPGLACLLKPLPGNNGVEEGYSPTWDRFLGALKNA